MSWHLLLAAAAALGACAAPESRVERDRIPLLTERPERPHEVIASVEARGFPGTHLAYVYDDLRRKALALGADAVVRVEERTHTDAVPPPSDSQDRPAIGNAYPGVLGIFEPGALPPAGFDVQTSGPYYVVDGLAIRFLDRR
jgi:hypothetical protein